MKIKTSIVSVSVMAALSAVASGQTYTTVNPPPSGEKSHAQILRDLYGSTFTMTSNGRDYVGGAVTAQRLADAGAGGPTSLSSGTVGAVDSIWSGESTFLVTARAKFAADRSQFGYFDDTLATPTFQSLFDTGTMNSERSVTLTGPFRWAIKNLSRNTLWTSNPGDNNGLGSFSNRTFDQLTTYAIDRPEKTGMEWVLFWEDRMKGEHADYDFNDAVIAITAQPIPAPASAALVGLGGMLMLRRRR